VDDGLKDLIEQVVAVLLLVMIPLLQRFFKKEDGEKLPAPADEVPWEDDVAADEAARGPADDLPAGPPAGPVLAAADPWADERAAAVLALTRVAARAEELARSIRTGRANQPFADTLTHFVAPRARARAHQVQRESGPPHGADDFELILGQIERFIAQRRHPALLGHVGDADAFAAACYRPIAQFAHAEGIGLTSHTPVTDLGHYSLAIWTALIPTGLAPIWLPHDFFRRLAWWPALAHEIGHDFYRATAGFDAGLRRHLQFLPQATSARPLFLSRDGITVHELYRVFGAWLEELFCDVFGVLMVGPAYAWTMIEHFASPGRPEHVGWVYLDTDGSRYGEHPPRHLRLLAAARALDLVGQSDDAAAVRNEWAARHGGMPEHILFPAGSGRLALPAAPLAAIVEDIVTRLYGDQLDVLAGYRLADIPGVDFGPYANAEAERVSAALRQGQVPHATRARAVIAGAVLAWRAQPEREREFIALARRAIVGTGTLESHAPARVRRPSWPTRIANQEARDAFVLHTILAQPPSLARLGLRPVRDTGFVERRGW
jgi:hypothetical protein